MMNTQILTALTLALTCWCASIGVAEDSPNIDASPRVRDDAPIVIYRKVYLHESLPELGARLYDKVDYELKLRELTRKIRIAEAELGVQRERVRVYDKYFGRSSALFVTRQNARLDALKSEENLKLLHQQKLLALRFRNDQLRYRQLLIAESAVRLRVAE